MSLQSITASMLYNLVQCPRRLYMDAFGNLAEKDLENPFVQLLWERGTLFEQEVIESLSLSFIDLRSYSGDQRERLTLEAMRRGDDLIYGGRISAGNLLGGPDLLSRRDNGYVAGDIKSGAGEEGTSELESGKPKKHYAVQLALYTDILDRLGLSAGHHPFVWDIHGQEVAYDLDAPLGHRNRNTLWDLYGVCLSDARAILSGVETPLPARSSICKLCHWCTVCTARLEQLDDLTLIPELGRSRRDALLSYVQSIKAFADAWTYILTVRPSVIYYYSPYERTIWRKLQSRYPAVCSPEDMEAMFSAETAVDLYQDVVRPITEWPTRDYSIKTLASYLGFRWRDTHPSGVASIQWYHHWVETRDPAVRQRILDYNEDDCIATRVLLDGIIRLTGIKEDR